LTPTLRLLATKNQSSVVSRQKGAALWRAPWQRKQFFFEKKNQKTFTSLGSLSPERPKPKRIKVFWFFFSKKNCFLHLAGFSGIHGGEVF